jgi:NADH-quinone oxidoreductase subunit K
LERKNENQLRVVSYEPQARRAQLRAQSFLNMPVNYYIFVALALFCIGVIGVLTRRNAIIVFMCIELMLNAVNLLLVAFSKMHYAINLARNLSVGTEGQLFVFFIMVVAAAEVSVGLAIIVMMYRNTHSTDINFLNRLKH